jgi:phosphoribulokinase
MLQRDMAERGHSEESIKASIEARKPDFDAYIDPQKKNADVIIQVRARQCLSVAAERPATSTMPR